MLHLSSAAAARTSVPTSEPCRSVTVSALRNSVTSSRLLYALVERSRLFRLFALRVRLHACGYRAQISKTENAQLGLASTLCDPFEHELSVAGSMRCGSSCGRAAATLPERCAPVPFPPCGFHLTAPA